MTYKTLDSEVVGDGGVDTQPADTFLQNRIAENITATASGHDAFSVSYLNNNPELDENNGDRPWASLYFISVMIADIPDWNRLSGVRITMLMNQESTDPVNRDEAGEFLFKLGQHSETVTSPTTYDAGTRYNSISFEINLDTPLLSAGEGTIPLEIWFRSRQGADVDGVGDRVINLITPAITYNGTYFTESGLTGPIPASFETRYIKANSNGSNSKPYDVIGSTEIGGDDGVYLYPDPVGDGQAEWNYLSYLQVRAIRIKPIFADDSVGQLPKLAYEPNKTFGSVEAQRETNSINRLDIRPRVLAVGPRGKFGYSETFDFKNYPTRWEHVAGDDGTETIIQDVAFLRTENPRLRFSIRYTSIHVGQSEAADEGDAVWDLDLSVKYSDDTSIGSESFELDSVIHGSFLNAPNPILRTMEYAHQSGSIRFAYKEGSLYEKDLPLIQTAVFDLELSGHDTAIKLGQPVEIKANLGLSNVVKYCSASGQSTSQVRFLLVGYTITEVPF